MKNPWGTLRKKKQRKENEEGHPIKIEEKQKYSKRKT
jgi:hypothetical protein